MSQLRVPRVHIVIPSKHTSRHKFEPRYLMPLFAAEHHGSLDDPSNPVHEEDHPADCRDPAFYWAEIESVDTEFERNSRLFHRVFRLVYPTRADFERAVEAEMDRGVEIEAAITRTLTPDAELVVEIPKWLSALDIKGLNDERKKAMVLGGLDTPGAVQKIDRLRLAEIVGAKIAKALKTQTAAAAPAEAAEFEDDHVIARRIPAPVSE